MLAIKPAWHAKYILELWVVSTWPIIIIYWFCYGFILDYSLLYLNIIKYSGLLGNQTEWLLDNGVTYNFVSS